MFTEYDWLMNDWLNEWFTEWKNGVVGNFDFFFLFFFEWKYKRRRFSMMDIFQNLIREKNADEKQNK